MRFKNTTGNDDTGDVEIAIPLKYGELLKCHQLIAKLTLC